MSSNKIKFLSKSDIQKCISMDEAINAMKEGFGEFSSGRVTAPQRVSMDLNEHKGGSLFMPVYMPSKNLVGLKTVTIHKENPSKNLPMIHALYSLFNAETGAPVAVMDGEYLTSLRTGAASGLASKLLAREDAKVAAVFGAGVQARTQLEAISAVRNLKKVFVYDSNFERAKTYSIEMSQFMKIEVIPAQDFSLLEKADIICTATSSNKPVFDDKYLNEGVHINGIGSYKPNMREIPADTIVRSKLIVDSRSASLIEAGDIIQPVREGLIDENFIHAEIGEIINGEKSARESDDELTIFKSVGNAVQDIAAAAVILDNSKKLNAGNYFSL